jgi:hypothetical protein
MPIIWLLLEGFLMAGGRPTKYKPEYCEKVIKVGKLGGSLTKMALACDVDKASLHDWAAKHEEFALALTRARAESLAWGEDQAQKNMGNAKFNSSLWKMMVGSQHREEYGEMKRALEITGKDGGPIQTQTTVIDPSSMDGDARDALRYAMSAVARANTSTDQPFEDDEDEE